MGSFRLMSSSHEDGDIEGRRACDALLRALRAADPNVARKKAGRMCAFRRSGSANFAYVLHLKRSPHLDVYFPSKPDDLFEHDGLVVPIRRNKISASGWTANFAWHFHLRGVENAEKAAEF